MQAFAQATALDGRLSAAHLMLAGLDEAAAITIKPSIGFAAPWRSSQVTPPR